jgi:hypothetical protein
MNLGIFFWRVQFNPLPETAALTKRSQSSIVGHSPRGVRTMIADNEIRDTNTLSICARLASRSFLPLTSGS